MEHLQRIVVHDKHPVFEPEVLRRPVNRLVILTAALSLGLQGVALVRVALGHGQPVGPFDHALFALVALLWLALGLLVFLQRRARRTGQLFALASAFGSAFVANGTLYSAGYFDAFVFTLGLTVFPAFIVAFARAFHEERPAHPLEILLFVPPLTVLWPGATGLAHQQTTIYWKIILLMVGLYLLAAALQARRDVLLARTPEAGAQARALLFGLIAGTLPGLTVFVGPIVLTDSVQYPITWIPPIILLFLVAMSYSVLLFEFSEADLIVRRGVVYGVLTVAIVIAYGALGVLLSAGRSSVSDPAGGLSFVAVTVLIGAAFTPLTYLARRLVDWLLYGRKTDRWQLLQDLTARLSRVMAPEGVGDVLVSEIAHALNLRGAFLLRRAEDGRYIVRHVTSARSSARYVTVSPGYTLDGEIIMAALGELPSSVLIVHARPFFAQQRGTLPDRVMPLDDLGAALSIPLVTRSGVEAVLCLQAKQAHDAFDADDLELLAPVVRQATAALDNALLFARLEENVVKLREAYLRIAREQEAERGRLARELHDGTAQELAGLITLATVAERQMEKDGTSARATLDRLKRQAQDAYGGVRRASHALRPLMLDDFGLGPTLERYIQGFGEATGISVDLTATDIEDLPDEVELALFRVAQECMENVRKHSGSPRARMDVSRHDGHVTLSVEDSGRGMVPGGEGGIGLAGMRERVEAVGGTIEVSSGAQGGVRVTAVVPVEEER